jgi:pimeloyl-ACP methyl ester carboxylesterase
MSSWFGADSEESNVSDVVLVHGIGAPDQTAQKLCTTWSTALMAGLCAQGAEEAATDLAAGRLRVSMAYYRHLFTPYLAEAEHGLLPPEQLERAESFTEDVLLNAEERASEPADRRDAARELEAFREELGAAQGAGEVLRVLVGALGRVKPLAAAGFRALSSRGIANLGQVASYLGDPVLRERAVETVLAQLGTNTRAVLAHSLGTVVAYEALHRLDQPLPLLVTMGSPLGLRTVVRERLRPHPLQVPPELVSWVNVADPDDFIAATVRLEKIVQDRYAVMAATRTVRNPGLNRHDAVKYLQHPEVLLPLVRALR